MSGGVSLNSVMVGKMYDWYPSVENIYVCPVPYDAGLAIGSAQYIYHQVMDNPRIKWKDNASPYLGRTYDLDNIEESLEQVKDKVSVEEVDDEAVAMLLTQDDNVISVFGGGSESGRRALGNRSILADPRFFKTKKIVNSKIKFRELFRPFAPSVIDKYAKEYFELDDDLSKLQPFKFMLSNYRSSLFKL